ncbi:methylated-DNA--[protein]-cysteine S-methyltransferase [Pseudomonas sp. N040]|uniref:methylated-DNA--[protein]-cysteine S-methyltransferase n=1 Tax=Pseudomonas sp. N040 TaxID=2785325 RepID=UPI0018A321A0|nr:methylated-DNA--[protein]-cysteine S-methyltransferase [Pseudomonas sp. N040]MBF7731719.1 methylated-DNA--[protein]-cysteine S-methyltransferase [Pseudomonas sp. N040]MBW7015363.1 methylated-DNA--[protein]-cysteine S-methyltransferase [Pseudomonas sp. N040]
MLDFERCWQAVCARDASQDGHFVFAVQTTGIYCRPACQARRPLARNIRFFADARAAEAAGFRPCRRCAPQGQSPAEAVDTLVSQVCHLLEHSESIPTLAQLAARSGFSASHLVREFKRRTGLTPKAWALARRDRLQAGAPRRKGANLQLRYAISPCPLGHVLLASTDKGVCALLFGDSPTALEAELAERFATASRTPDQPGLGAWLQQVLQQLHEPARAAQLPLDLQGSAFQQRVWQALQKIPAGQTRNYGQLAAELGSHPRAVARACASNPVGLLVPCHRVIAANGSLSGYRWGLQRKAALLAAEAL